MNAFNIIGIKGNNFFSFWNCNNWAVNAIIVKKHCYKKFKFIFLFPFSAVNLLIQFSCVPYMKPITVANEFLFIYRFSFFYENYITCEYSWAHI